MIRADPPQEGSLMPATDSRTLDGLYNFRDVGGTDAEGGTIRAGVLFRSDSLHALTPTGVGQFPNTGISTIVDLRSRIEAEQSTGPVAESELADYLSLPLLEGAIADTVQQVPTLEQLYTHLVDDAGDSFARIGEWIAWHASGGVLVHCTAGKDRTGVAVALLLEAVGADRDQVLADYVVSEQNLAGEWAERALAMAERMGAPDTDAVRMVICGTDAEAMRGTLEHVDRVHGGARAYLAAHGLDENTLTALTNRLVEPADRLR